MNKIPKLNYNLESIRNDGTQLITASATINGKRLRFSTATAVNAKYWNGRRAKTSVHYANEAGAINNVLANIESVFNRITSKASDNVTAETIKKEIEFELKRKTRTGIDVVDFYSFAERQVLEMKVTASPNSKTPTWQKLNGLINMLRCFETDIKYVINWDSLNWKFLQKFKKYSYNNYKHSANTVNKNVSLIRNLIRESNRLGIHDNKIYLESDFGEKRVKTKKICRLKFDELEILERFDLSAKPHLEYYRDLFVAMCFTGLRISDWDKISKENLTTYKEKAMFETLTFKTGAIVNIPLFKPLKRILKKYKYDLTPVTEQVFNRSIKEIIKIVFPKKTVIVIRNVAGKRIEKREPMHKIISAHDSRRTFASNFYEICGSARTVMLLTGHTTESAFFQYIDYDDSIASKDAALELLESFERKNKLKVV